MASHSPPGMRFDTSVPERCTATNLELSLRGADACPPGSRLGGGTAEGSVMGSRGTLAIDVFNNAGEQIFVVATPGLASIARGKIHPGGAVEFAAPTCYPSVEPPGCPADNALQTGSDIVVPPYTREVDGRTRSYLTTPPSCPASGAWETPIEFFWADGAHDTVVTRQPCRAPSLGLPPAHRCVSRRRFTIRIRAPLASPSTAPARSGSARR